MDHVRRTVSLGLPAVGLLLLSVWCAAPAAAQTLRRASLDTLVEKADTIFTARCTRKQTVFHEGNLVTRYRLKPDEVWKGRLKLDREGEVELEELGGTMSEPLPLTQYRLGMANLAEGEDVLLFTAYAEPLGDAEGLEASRPSLKPGGLRIVGSEQGRYTIVHHPETGEQLVMRGATTMPEQIARPPLMTRLARRPSTGTLTEAEQREARRLAQKVAQRGEKARLRSEMARSRPGEAEPRPHEFEPLAAVRGRVLATVERLAAREHE